MQVEWIKWDLKTMKRAQNQWICLENLHVLTLMCIFTTKEGVQTCSCVALWTVSHTHIS